MTLKIENVMNCKWFTIIRKCGCKPKFVEPFFSHNDFLHQTQLEKGIEPSFFSCQS
jgi:hypothetical protein